MSPAEGQAGSAGATKSPAKAKSEVANVTGEGEAPKAATQQSEAPPDEEFDIEGEKIAKSKLFEHYKRQKEFERASHKRMQEAAEVRKAAAQREAEIEQAFSKLNDDPYAVYRARGFSDEQIDQIAEQRLLTRMKRAQMTPEQLEAEQIRAENAQMKQRLQQVEGQQKSQERQALEQQYYKQYDEQIAQAMELGNLPRTASTGAKVAAVLAEYLQAGETIDPALAAQIVRNNHRADISHEFSELHQNLTSGRITPEKYMAYMSDMLGPDTIKWIQTYSVKQAQAFQPQKPKGPAKPAPLPQKTFDSFDEANAWIGKRINNV